MTTQISPKTIWIIVVAVVVALLILIYWYGYGQKVFTAPAYRRPLIPVMPLVRQPAPVDVTEALADQATNQALQQAAEAANPLKVQNPFKEVVREVNNPF